MRSNIEVDTKITNENVSEIIMIRDVASRLVDVALGSVSKEMNGKHVMERHLEVSIRK